MIARQTMPNAPQLLSVLVCPACRAPFHGAGVDTPDPADAVSCDNAACRLVGTAFPLVNGKPVLVDFDRSILVRGKVLAGDTASVIPRDDWRTRLARIVNGTNHVSAPIARGIVAALERVRGRRARLLVVGGGAMGSGAEPLYASDAIDLIAFDIYASPLVDFVADGHAIPLADGSVDAVWVQAVMEHVTDPVIVVGEIVRVLRADGIVFADTPFLWPVHEKAYDFTRWTPSGHRWLFRDFEVLAAGSSSGPGTASLLALRYLAASLTRSSKLGQLLTLPFIWLRLLDRWCSPRRGLDGAAGLYLLGRKTPRPIDAAALVRFYEDQLGLEERTPRLRRGEVPAVPTPS